MRLRCTILTAAVLLLGPGMLPLSGRERPSPEPNHKVACLDRATGRVLWQTDPGPLYPPWIRVSGDIVVAEDDRSGPGFSCFQSTFLATATPFSPKPMPPGLGDTPRVYALDLATGRVLGTGADRTNAERATGPLPALPRNLLDAQGRQFLYDRFPLTSLRYQLDGRTKYLRMLPQVGDLRIHSDLAIMRHSQVALGALPLAGHGSHGLLAYSLDRGYVVWRLSAWELLPGATAGSFPWTLGIDEDLLLIEYDQTIFAVSPTTARPRWRTTLPRQAPEEDGFCLTLAARDRDRLWVSCQQRLFALNRDTGEIVWDYLCPGHGVLPWPTVVGDRVLLGVCAKQDQAPPPPHQGGASASTAPGRFRRAISGDGFMPTLFLGLLLCWLWKFHARWLPVGAAEECPTRARAEWMLLMLFIAGFTFFWCHVFLLTRWPTYICRLTIWLALATIVMSLVSAIRARFKPPAPPPPPATATDRTSPPDHKSDTRAEPG